MDEVVDTMRELGNIGSGNAAASLEDWLGEPITISITEARLLPVEEVSSHIDGARTPILGIHSRITGGLEGHMAYLLSKEETKRVLSILMGEADDGGALTDCQASALSETGNVLFGSYVSALYEMLGEEIDISPPLCSHDPGSFLGGDGEYGYRSGRQHVMVVETLLINEAALSCSRLLFFTWVEKVREIIEHAGPY